VKACKSKSGKGSKDSKGSKSVSGVPLSAIEAVKESCATLASQCNMVLEKLMEAALSADHVAKSESEL
jgi:hypothetical protein